MKWVFLAFLVVYTPLLAGWLRANPKHAPKVWGLLGLLPFLLGPWDLYIAPISWATWPGFVRGAEVSLLDAVALAVLISTPHRTRLPLKWPFILYLAAILLSALISKVPTAALFYAWQTLRVFLMFAAVAAACQDGRAPKAIVTGLVLGLAYHAVAIFSASRATIGLVGAGLIGLFALSALRRPTSRKAGMVLAGGLALAIAAPLAFNSLERRFEAAPLRTDYAVDGERVAFENAATSMLNDYPYGVGANQFVTHANVGGYYQRAGVTWSSYAAHVHHVYLLVAAETGYQGLLAFIALLASPILVAFRTALRNRKDPRGELLLGLGFSLVIVAVHSLYEWIFVSFQTQYMFGIVYGLIVGLAREMGYGCAAISARARREHRRLSDVPAEVETAPV